MSPKNYIPCCQFLFSEFFLCRFSHGKCIHDESIHDLQHLSLLVAKKMKKKIGLVQKLISRKVLVAFTVKKLTSNYTLKQFDFLKYLSIFFFKT